MLIELGFAMKALGQSKILLVMNTAFGPTEKLPFDLRQKRVTTYHLPEDAEKPLVRKELRAALGAALKAILRDHQEAMQKQEPPRPPLSDEAVQAIRAGRSAVSPIWEARPAEGLSPPPTSLRIPNRTR